MPNKPLGRVLLCCLILLATACGRKAPPQIQSDAPPRIAELQHEIAGNSLKLTLRLVGGEAGVGYQIDRAELDPYCKCPSMWRRYFELPPHPKYAGKPLVRILNLRSGKQTYFFRVRAVDGLGRLGPWSRPIRARAEAMDE